jgi:branched-chain amino acid transport system permease protein
VGNSERGMRAPDLGIGTAEESDHFLSAEAEAAVDRDAAHPTGPVAAFEERSGWDRTFGLAARRTFTTPGRLVLMAAVVAFLVVLGLNQDQLNGVVLGIGSGALIAGLALSIVVTYRGSGVVNFAAGAVAMYAGYVFHGLQNGGQFIIIPLPNPFAPVEGIAHDLGDRSLRLPHWPTFASVGGHWGLWPALLMSVFLAMIVGLLIHLCIFWPLRHAPALAKVVASIGLLIAIQSIIVLRFTATALSFNALLPSNGIHLPDNIILPANEPILLGIVVAVAIALAATYRYTKFGLRTRAAAENEKGAVLRGFSPDTLAGTNWMLSTALAAVIGILAASIDQSLDPTTITLLVIPAIAAALLGKFTSVSLTVVAALAIGFIQAWIDVLSTQRWFPQVNGQALPGLEELVPVLAIVGVLWFRGKHLPARGSLETTRLPYAPKPAWVYPWAAIGLVAGVVSLLTLGPSWRGAIINSIVGVVMCLSLVTLTGYVGQISLAQMAFAGTAGFFLSRLAVTYGVAFPWAPLIAIFGATIVGMVVAIPALRVRGVNLAAVTLAAGMAIEALVFDNPWFSTANGASGIPSPHLFGLRFGPTDPTVWSLVGYHGDGKQPDPWFGVFCLVVLIAIALCVAALRQSKLGRRMLAVRANERAAAATGVNVTAVKLSAFAIASLIAGIGGVLAAYNLASATDAYYGGIASLLILAYAYLGGISSISGSMVGGLLAANGIGFTIMSEWFGVSLLYSSLVGGVGLVLTAILNPEGIAGANRILYQKLRAKVKESRVHGPDSALVPFSDATSR